MIATEEHCFGIGEADTSVLAGPEETRHRRTTRELHRLESAQADFLLDHLGDITPGDRLLDAGCGRGGGSIVANQRFGCSVDGVSISRKQVDFANTKAAERGVADKVAFHLANMLATGFEPGAYRGIWNNESTMYVNLDRLFAAHARLPRSWYFKAMAANDLVPVSVVDLTRATLPYWYLRQKSRLVTGIEEAFIEGYENGSFPYLLIAADRV
ncbi:SAM-dependent methyltransferase [Streptomyces sp. NPDC051567]|uniref:SAM-dependent methyltransferase n=1 Tax=Streptomyces sp. NPDC051567 TaxID=3365660 RepID=UPI0037A31FBE